MANLKKILVGLGITGGLVAGFSYLMRLRRTSSELESETTVNVQKLDLTGLTLRVDSLLKNPTKTALKMKFPYVKLIYKDATLASSQVVDKDIEVPAFGEAHIEKIMIQIPIMGLFSLGGDFLQSLKSGNPVKLQAKTITTIDLGWKKLPYEKTDEINLKA